MIELVCDGCGCSDGDGDDDNNNNNHIIDDDISLLSSITEANDDIDQDSILMLHNFSSQWSFKYQHREITIFYVNSITKT